MLNVMDVAKFFIDFANESDDVMTNLRLQKLLYYTQGCSLRKFGEPLFDSKIEAWKLGSVIPEVYHQYTKATTKIRL